MGRKTLLTTELIDKIAGYIAAGAFDHVAAAAAGVSSSTFYNWLRDGEAEDADALKVEFLQKVSEAKATARRDAEARVFTEKPLEWLRYGPGKTRHGADGWTQETVLNVNTGADGIKLVWSDQGED